MAFKTLSIRIPEEAHEQLEKLRVLASQKQKVLLSPKRPPVTDHISGSANTLT